MQLSPGEFDRLVKYIKEKVGIHMGKEKKVLLEGRLSMVVQQRGYSNYSEYLDALNQDKTGEMHRQFVERITTNHTFFLREKDHFDFVRQRMLPDLKTWLKSKDIRGWSAGCSSGEEPYTLAMTFSDALGIDRNSWNVQLLATDISNKILLKASSGIYEADQVADIPQEWLRRYFHKPDENGQFQITHQIKDMILFRSFNLMNPFPFKKKFHFIFCRNVMIYFDEPTRQILVKKYFDALEPGGYFFISHSETLGRNLQGFEYISPSIYRKPQLM
ncbi:MAG: protein-glutamate O-methyltransferase CheR [Eubacteriales bacterium]|nr:protein-glutamate O-methyltransferase CheR [Eubacteriales bacterium]MDD3502839.1 protein-glutamate O-methyltransferase CheR [Eubacteriales bacterium]MDD4683575.1 protein-glutamate O-methyltransferase CheR [Eubacteriales bacterium]